MSGGGGKGGQTTSETKIDPRLEEEALKNLKQARAVSELPYAPNMGLSVAAFTPQQEAAFQTANKASSAFGLPTGSTSSLPTPRNVGGFSGYSSENLYNDAMSKVPSNVLALYNALFASPSKPATAAATGTTKATTKANSLSGKGGGVMG